MSEKIDNFKQLKIWQMGIEIARDVYVLTERFPKEEMYGLTSQVRRASVSIPSNVAEGFKRNHCKEFSQFIHVALGSAAEIETQLIVSREVGYINTTDLKNISNKLDQFSRMATSLLKKMH